MTKKAQSNGQAAWRNRITGYGSVDPEELLANPLNYRIHPKAQQDALAGTLNQIGWIQDVIVNAATGFVLDGHLRVALALRTHQPEIPVKYVELTPEEEALALATLDPLTSMAGTDAAKLDELLQQVQTDEAAIQEMLAGLAESAGLHAPKDEPSDAKAQIDRAEELRQKWGVELGQLWRLPSRTPGQEHRLICGDCTDAAVVERVMGGELAQMIFTDPPYGVDYEGGTTKRELLKGDTSPNLYAPALAVFHAASVDKAPMYLWHSDSKSAAVSAAGYELRCTIIWNKNQAQFGALSAQYKTKHEPCYYLYKRGQSPYWYGPTNEITVWDIDRASKNELHPTQKPIELAQRAIRNSSASGDLVLDGFCGSASTLIACENLSRQCRAVELSPGYCAVALERYFQAFGIRAELVG